MCSKSKTRDGPSITVPRFFCALLLMDFMILIHSITINFLYMFLFYLKVQVQVPFFHRSSCPGGVGNLGFNSFNMMTFMLLSLNAVANVNNNINNNNNNNFNINYNSISSVSKQGLYDLCFILFLEPN